MPFCSRCGEACTTRCKCGGFPQVLATNQLFKEKSDKWSSRYLARSPTPLSSPTQPSSTKHSETATNPVSQSSENAYASSFPSGSTSKPVSSPVHPDNENLNVFGNLLSPRDQWQCVACERKFKQEETIYPDPAAKDDPSLAEVFYCRACFAQRFSLGRCKRCKNAVLTDAPFIKHGELLWHKICYVCTYCEDPRDIIIDMAGSPSCEQCFDSAAYSTQGVPPSPHLSRTLSTNAKPLSAPSKYGAAPTLPAYVPSATSRILAGRNNRAEQESSKSLWGAPVVSSAAFDQRGSTKVMGIEDRSEGWRIRKEREKSPMVNSFNELSDKLRRVGLEDRPRPGTTSLSSVKGATSSKQSLPSAKPTSTTPPLQPRVPTAKVAVRPDQPIKESSHDIEIVIDTEHCGGCKLDLGYGDFAQLPSGQLFHPQCFICRGCRLTFTDGKYVAIEDEYWHAQCAPPVTRTRTIVTSLIDHSDDDIPDAPRSNEAEGPTECHLCRRSLDKGISITLPRTGHAYHQSCLKCDGCKKGFGVIEGDRSFVEMNDTFYHSRCTPLRLPTVAKASPTSALLRSSTSRAPSLPLPPREPPQFLPVTTTPPPRSIFSTGTVPASFGRILLCAGCNIRTTILQSVGGPRGKRYHSQCLKCECGKVLDSECRVDEQGRLRCESCLKLDSKAKRLHSQMGAAGVKVG